MKEKDLNLEIFAPAHWNEEKQSLGKIKTWNSGESALKPIACCPKRWSWQTWTSGDPAGNWLLATLYKPCKGQKERSALLLKGLHCTKSFYSDHVMCLTDSTSHSVWFYSFVVLLCRRNAASHFKPNSQTIKTDWENLPRCIYFIHLITFLCWLYCQNGNSRRLTAIILKAHTKRDNKKAIPCNKVEWKGYGAKPAQKLTP